MRAQMLADSSVAFWLDTESSVVRRTSWHQSGTISTGPIHGLRFIHRRPHIMMLANVASRRCFLNLVSTLRAYRTARGDKKGRAAAFPVSRGTLLGPSPRESLLWTHGDVRGIDTRGAYFQGGRSTPRPLRLVRFAGHGTWDDTARAILGLTKMDWNNDALYEPLPVTLGYAKVLARVVKRMPGLGSTPYRFRFFM